MLKVMLLLHKRDDLSQEAFQRHWRETHQPLIARLPGYRRSIVNYALPAPEGSAPAYDGIGETWFASAEVYQAAMASPEGQAVFADAANFLDLTKMQIIAVQEEEIPALTGAAA
jgi:uncharacterized protein (TIGR02118 family)